MKWEKLGQIFNPLDHKLPLNCKAFAKSPQAIVFEDFVRVYFSSTETDQVGKLLSHVMYVDYDLKFKSIISLSSHQVIPLGGLGCFDEHGIFPFNVLRDGPIIRAYTTGWNRKVSVSADAAIGYAESHDEGKTFQKFGSGPILAASLHEPFLVGDAFVMKTKNDYHMWYIFGSNWLEHSESGQKERVYKIAYAKSSDGIYFERTSKYIIADRLAQNECQALPSIVEINGTYHMYFCYRDAFGFRTDRERGYRIGYAYSTNLQDWNRDDARGGMSLSLSGWDADMMCYPFVFHCGDEVYMLYNGNEFGRYGFGIARLVSDY